jgi:predicted DNA-binding transcriptional regulator AlpA
MTTDELVLQKLDALISAVQSSAVTDRWLSASDACILLGYNEQVFRERICIIPGFPKALRLNGVGHPRWLRSEILDWAAEHRDRPCGRKRAA